MRAARRESTRERMISIMATIMLVLVISIGFLVAKAAAQSDKYSKMTPVDQYLMERNAEILLARSAAPESISSDATILVLGRQGYETAVRGKNGFVCMVERSWMEAFDSPEFWNPKLKGIAIISKIFSSGCFLYMRGVLAKCPQTAWRNRFSRVTRTASWTVEERRAGREIRNPLHGADVASVPWH